MKRYWIYLLYVLRHKRFVYQEGRKLHLSRLRLLLHDWDKFLPGMFISYAKTFYNPQGEKCYQPHEKFMYYWLKHIHRNKHHWQHWVLQKDDGGIYVEDSASVADVLEMLADWRGAGRAQAEGLDTKDFYLSRYASILLSDTARELVDHELGIDELSPEEIKLTEFLILPDLYSPVDVELNTLRSIIGYALSGSLKEIVIEDWHDNHIPAYSLTLPRAIAQKHFRIEQQSGFVWDNTAVSPEALFGLAGNPDEELTSYILDKINYTDISFLQRLLEEGELTVEGGKINLIDKRLYVQTGNKVAPSDLLISMSDVIL